MSVVWLAAAAGCRLARSPPSAPSFVPAEKTFRRRHLRSSSKPLYAPLRVVRPHHLPAALLTATNDLPEGDTGVAWVISPKQESL